MQAHEVTTLIQQHIPDAQVRVEGEGCSFSLIVVSPSFEGLTLLKKQQVVMALFSDRIASGEMHALTVKAYTPEQWAGLNDAR